MDVLASRASVLHGMRVPLSPMTMTSCLCSLMTASFLDTFAATQKMPGYQGEDSTQTGSYCPVLGHMKHAMFNTPTQICQCIYIASYTTNTPMYSACSSRGNSGGQETPVRQCHQERNTLRSLSCFVKFEMQQGNLFGR